MKPKFRIGDRVRTIGLGDEWIVAGVDPLDTRRVYVSFDYNGTIAINEQPWYLEHELELVGCGIPAPVLDLLRWQPVVDGRGNKGLEIVVFGHIRYGLWGSYRATLNGRPLHESEDGSPVIYKSEQEVFLACQKHWEELWDKEMLISRDLPETGE